MRTSSYKKEYAIKVIELMSQGMSAAKVAKELGVSRPTLIAWSTDKKKQEFGKAWKQALEAREAWWDELCRQVASGVSKGNAAVLCYYMKTQFGGKWKEDGMSNTTDINITYANKTEDELKKEIKHLLTKRLPKSSQFANQEQNNIIELPVSEFRQAE